ncbi:AtpZ/AtpI family protein [Hydrogenophaga sp.]|uniref:AtpZ/AtpI family protein n=1 Tax=Hydrogenophaga sp. TaxID=1904254 RepID=UPI0035687D2B
MTEPGPKKTSGAGPGLAEQVNAKARRKLNARRHASQGLWFGLGMMGLVGWSVVVPTLLGAALGMWLDAHQPGRHPWTLALLVAGLVLGCFNAWHWVSKEDRAMREDKQDGHDADT